MADDQQFEPLGQVLTPQTLAMMRYQQMQRAMDQAGQLPGAQYAARVGGLSIGRAIAGLAGGGNGPLDQLAAQNQGDINASGVAQGNTAAQATAGMPPMEIQARNYENLASRLSAHGQTGAAAMMQDKANALRQLQANLEKTQADTGEAQAKAGQAEAEAAKARRFSVWKQDPDQTGVAPNKTRYIDQNGYAAPEIRDQGNLPDYTTTDVIVPGGTQTALYDKHNGRLIMQPGVRPYYGQVNMDVAKDLQKRISTINQGRVALANADPYLNDAVGLQAVAAQHGGSVVNLFTRGSANPKSTQAIAAVDSGNQLARAALRVTGRYSNSQDRDIQDLLPEVEGITRNAQHERTKLWGTEGMLAQEENVLRQNYRQIMGDDTRALPPAIPSLRDADLAKQQAAQRPPQAAPVPPQAAAPPPGQDQSSATPDNPRGQVGRPPNPPPQDADFAPALDVRGVKLKDGRRVTYTVH